MQCIYMFVCFSLSHSLCVCKCASVYSTFQFSFPLGLHFFLCVMGFIWFWMLEVCILIFVLFLHFDIWTAECWRAACAIFMAQSFIYMNNIFWFDGCIYVQTYPLSDSFLLLPTDPFLCELTQSKAEMMFPKGLQSWRIEILSYFGFSENPHLNLNIESVK